MNKVIGIRREDKNEWERRVPLIPAHIAQLKQTHSIDFIVQKFPRRAFTEEEFREAGAQIDENLDQADIIFAVKEIPIPLLLPDKTYLFFSHTIKGQAYNMPLLQALLDLNATLIDYERIADDQGRRLVFFGRFAGMAGMIDTLYGLGQRFAAKGLNTCFSEVKPAYQYGALEDAKKQLRQIGEKIRSHGLPADAAPYIFGFAGYGNVSNGAQEIFDLLPHQTITAEELLSGKFDDQNRHLLIKLVFHEHEMVQPADTGHPFNLSEYFGHPERYKSIFTQYLPKLSVLINAIYWNVQYPRLLTKAFLKEHYQNIRLELVYDISCDIHGAIEITDHTTVPDNPAYVYEPASGNITPGYSGTGIVNMAVDNLPTEVPRDSSIAFSHSLLPFIAAIASADYDKDFDSLDLPTEIKRAVITHKGKLTADYQYLYDSLNKHQHR